MPRILRDLILLLLGLGLGYAVAQRTAAPRETATKKLALVEADNERLRGLVRESEQTKQLARDAAQRAKVERAVEAIRGLKFKRPVDYAVLGRAQIREVLSKKLGEIYSEEEFRNITAALARFGLLPRGYPLRERYIDLLGEQVAAFYDQHTHKLYMFEDATLDNAQNRIVLAHELTHALQDQHFVLARLPLEIKDNDDRALAASALCEGDATLVMSEYMLKNLSLATLKDNLGATMTQNVEQLAKAPRFLRESLIFPYLRGQEFCGALFAQGGYKALDAAYAEPPASTSQILHPEKYAREPREAPIAVTWPREQIEARKPIADNVAGELGIRLLLTEWGEPGVAEQAASGWRGDRYLCFDGGEALVWKTVWSDAAQAAEFLEAARAGLARRYAEEKRHVRWQSPRPEEVVLIDAASADAADALEIFAN